MNILSGRIMVCGLAALTFYCSQVQVAIAQDTQWEWTHGLSTKKFTTKQAALQDMWSKSEKDALFTVESPGNIHSSKTSYTYRAPHKEHTESPWSYYIGTVRYTTEEALIASLTADEAKSAPVGCPKPILVPNSDWSSSSYLDGIPRNGARRYGVTNRYGSSVYGDPCFLMPDKIAIIYRERQLTCPQYYGWRSAIPHCGVSGERKVQGRPVICSAHNAVSTRVGNPCDVATGAKTQTEQDFSVTELRFSRTYSSINGESHSNLGVGWTHNYAKYLILASGTPAGIYRGNAYHSDLSQSSSTRYIANDGSGLQVVKTNGTWQVHLNDGVVESYDSSGKLARIDDHGKATILGYDQGKLVFVSGPYGHFLRFEYEGDRISRIGDPDEHYVAYSYDDDSNLTLVTYPDGRSRRYLYEDPAFPNHLTGIVDEGGVKYASFSYDSLGRAVSTEHAGGVERYAISYGTTTSTVVHPNGAIATYTFTNDDHPRRVKHYSINELTRIAVIPNSPSDRQRRITQLTDERGLITKFAYSAYHLTSKTEAFGTPSARTTTYQYRSLDDDLPTQLDEPGRRTSITYDASGNLLTRTITDTASNTTRTWTYTYNQYGQVLTTDGPRTDVNDVTTYMYYTCTTGYQCGQVHTITNALNQTTTYNSYNAHGQPLTITDPNGVVTTLTYDLRQRLTSRTVGTEISSFEYWPTGLLKKATLPDQSYIEYSYDAAHRLIGIHDAEGNRIAYTLDAMGNRTQEEVYDPSNSLSTTRSRVFNQLNRLSQELTASNSPAEATSFGYDPNGNQTSINAPLGRNSVNAYDELNRLTQVTDPQSGLTRYGYNALDQLISVTDPRNKVTGYTYNALGDLTQQVSPDTGTTTNTYDSAGNLKTTTDARNKTATYQYDALNRVTQHSYPDQMITYHYDQGANAKGRLSNVTDHSGQTGWVYDSKGRVIQRTQLMGALQKSVSYGYNGQGQLTSLTLPSGNVIGYSYQHGKVSGLTVNGQPVLNQVAYEPFGPIRGWTWGNGTLAIRDFDLDGKIQLIDSAGLKTYGYDNAFRITGITDATDPARSQSYGYDLLDRLTQATGASLNQSWTYDANGNRTAQGGSQSSTYVVATANNRINSVTGSLTRTYSYDAAGNTLSDGERTFTYNDAGRMVTATKNGITTAYLYNALGQRVRKSNINATTHFVYDEAGHLLGEYNATGQLIQEIVWLGDIPVASIRSNEQGTGVSYFYIHTDHLNAPTKLTAFDTNVIVWRWDRDPFGNGVPNEDPDGNGLTVRFDLRFPGQIYDIETGNIYNGFRTYSPEIGRYTTSDPIGLKGGLNTYVYVGGNPLSWADPTGLSRCKCIANPSTKDYPGPNGSDGERNWLKRRVVKIGCDYSCVKTDGSVEIVRATHYVSFWFEEGYELRCLAVPYEQRYANYSARFIWEPMPAERFDPEGSGSPELEKWAKDKCEACNK